MHIYVDLQKMSLSKDFSPGKNVYPVRWRKDDRNLMNLTQQRKKKRNSTFFFLSFQVRNSVCVCASKILLLFCFFVFNIYPFKNSHCTFDDFSYGQPDTHTTVLASRIYALDSMKTKFIRFRKES